MCVWAPAKRAGSNGLNSGSWEAAEGLPYGPSVAFLTRVAVVPEASAWGGGRSGAVQLNPQAAKTSCCCGGGRAGAISGGSAGRPTPSR